MTRSPEDCAFLPARTAALSPEPYSRAVILLVEDDPGDQILIREALDANPYAKMIRVVGDGMEALDYMHRRGRYAPPEPAPRPDLIVMDLNMPRLNGKETAARLKTDPATRSVPIIIFSTSDLEKDVAECYAVGVNSYIQKPSDFDRLQALLGQVERYWFEVSQPQRLR